MLTLSKKILVAIDGSPQSDKAAEEAVRLAAQSGTRLRSQVYAVLVLPSLKPPSFTDFFPTKPPTEEPDWQEKRDRLFYVVEKAAGEAGVDLESLIVYGDPAEELIYFAREKGCDVIVIGSSGKGMVKRTVLGSVSTKVALQAQCSVYIVR
ncbi:MAG: universal stress protein [Deltaproteobacteria bacterium]|nr:MAG: universal stress protein [Deltaproteobacteria bacterium]